MSDITGHRFGVVAIDGEVAERLREETARHWKLLLAIGILCDIAGVYSIFVPIVASISVAVLVGWVLLFAGVVQFAHALRRDPTWSWDDGLAAARVGAHDRGGRVDPACSAERDDHAHGCARGLVLGHRRDPAARLVEDAQCRAQLDDRAQRRRFRWCSASSSGPTCRARPRGPSACWSVSSCSSPAPS